jgi:hypothetical protein
MSYLQSSAAAVVPENHKAEAQQAIDELLSEHLIPFKLRAGKVASEDYDEFTVWFFDSRLHSVTVPWKTGQSFKGKIRAAILDRVSRFTAPVSVGAYSR